MRLSDWLSTRSSELPDDNPTYAARLLAEAVTGLTPTCQRIYDPELDAASITTLDELVARRCHGEPIAYILGHQPFYTLDLLVNPHTLIPRGDSECVLMAALDKLPCAQPALIADLGTGSGALALAIASERPQIQVIATDRSYDALQIAVLNRDRYQLHNVSFVCANWFDAFAPACFDLMISNPPYIAEDDPHLVALTYEPRSALVAADQGLADLQYLITHAATYLKLDGWLLLEHGYDQGAHLRQFAHDLAQWQNITTLRDYGGNERVTMMQHKPL